MLDEPVLQRLGHRPPLDGLRGVAIALVVALHSGLGYHFLGGGLGVDVFFALSGFLITSLLLEERVRTGRIGLGRFYLRRVLRLYPGLVGLVVGGFCFYWILSGDGTFTGYLRAAAGALLYIGDFANITGDGHFMGDFGHTWSLAIEEQFYLLWPPILIGCLATRRRHLPALVLLVGILASWVELYRLYFPTFLGIPAVYYRPDSRAAGLLVGCLASVLLHHYAWAWRLAKRPLITLAGVVVLLFAVASAGKGPLSDLYIKISIPLTTVAATLLICGVVANGTSLAARALSHPVLIWLGGISYGVYLWHVPANFVMDHFGLPLNPGIPVRIGVGILLGWLSTRYVEQPFRRRKDQMPTSAERLERAQAAG